MDYLAQAKNIAAQQIAKKLTALNAKQALFINVREMYGDSGDKAITANMLNSYATTTLDMMEEQISEYLHTSNSALTFLEVLFIAQHSELVMQYIKQ